MLFDPDHACLESTIPLRLQYFSVQPAEDQEVFVVGGGSLGGSGWWAGWCIRGEHGLDFTRGQTLAGRQSGSGVRDCVLILGRSQRSACQVSAPPTSHNSSPLAGPTASKAGPSLQTGTTPNPRPFPPLSPLSGLSAQVLGQARQGREAGSMHVCLQPLSNP